MADYKHFRIIVDLSAFFYDHRRVARVFVKRNLKSIADLQSRISEIFDISEFYLTTGGHFLPASEDIRILNNNESVCATPYNPQEIARQSILKVTSSTEKGNKKHKRPLEPIPEDADETPTRKNKKDKKKHVNVNVHSSSCSEDEVPRKKKKSETNKSISIDETCSGKNNQKKVKQNDEICEQEVPHNKKNQGIVERQICNIESSQKIIDIKKKLKQKADDYIKKHSKEASCNLVDTSNIKNVLPKLQSHIKSCNDLGRSTFPDTVRLSRHADTPIKTFIRYTPPPRITDTYLAKNKINIVKIDVVKKGSEDVNEQPNGSQSSANSDNTFETSNQNLDKSNILHSSDVSYSPPKNYVKEVINTFERSISPEPKIHVGEQEIDGLNEKNLKVLESEASDYTKAFLDQRDLSTLENLESETDIALNLIKDSVDVAPVLNIILNGVENQGSPSETHVLKTEDPPIAKQLNKEMDLSNISLDISSLGTPLDTSNYLSSKDASLNTSNTSLNLNNPSFKARNTTTVKKFGGVGSLLGRLRESDCAKSHESDASSQNVTKRKRIRKHKRKSKKSDGHKSTHVIEDTFVAKPMNVKACPSIHIKFGDNEMDTLEEKFLVMDNVIKETNTDINCTVNEIGDSKIGHKQHISDINENQSLLAETMVLSDENDDPIMENKSIFGEQSISKAPVMTDKLEPKVGDVIAFKVIKMTKDYTPQVSNYIVGKLEIYLLDSKIVYFKILRGEEELKPPTGKLSLEPDTDVQLPLYKDFLWTDLVEPKLLYP